jgi:hypothetical protein
MFILRRLGRVAAFVSSLLLSAGTALAQTDVDVSQPESSEMLLLLVVFCAVIVALLGYTARRMATLP